MKPWYLDWSNDNYGWRHDAAGFLVGLGVFYILFRILGVA